MLTWVLHGSSLRGLRQAPVRGDERQPLSPAHQTVLVPERAAGAGRRGGQPSPAERVHLVHKGGQGGKAPGRRPPRPLKLPPGAAGGRPGRGPGREAQTRAVRRRELASSSAITSSLRKRRWPPTVRRHGSLPEAAQLMTVRSVTSNIAATSWLRSSVWVSADGLGALSCSGGAADGPSCSGARWALRALAMRRPTATM